MKKSIITILLTAFIITLNGQLMFAQTKNDSSEIMNTCNNYLEGWYTGNAERMDDALHENLVKRRVSVLKQTGANLINQVSANDMIEYTKAGFGKLKENEEMKIDIQIVNIHKGIANVIAVSKNFVDYIHLAEFNGEWKIINVLWETNE